MLVQFMEKIHLIDLVTVVIIAWSAFHYITFKQNSLTEILLEGFLTIRVQCGNAYSRSEYVLRCSTRLQ